MASFRIFAASLMLFAGQAATADEAAPQADAAPFVPQGYGYSPAPAQAPYGGPVAAPYAAGPYGAAPYAGVPYGGGPYSGGPYAGGPYGGAPYGGGPFNGGSPFRGMPFMQSFDMSRPDSFNPMRQGVWGGGPPSWVDPGDPKEGMSRAWDDMMNAPHRMGRVPPGWKAPSISIPNPIDVGDEFEKNARRAPYIMRDNFSFN